MLMTLHFDFIIQAVEYFQRVLAIEEENGEIWSSLGRPAVFCIHTLIAHMTCRALLLDAG